MIAPTACQDSVETRLEFMKDLPADALKSKYRILISECSSNHIEELQGLAEEFTLKSKQNSYFIKNGDLVQLQTGDYSSKEFAKARLSWLRENIKKCSLVKANNDSIILMVVFKERNCLIRTAADETVQREITAEINDALKSEALDLSLWDKPKYLVANTAVNEDYLSSEEKKVYYYLNLMRMNPGLFAVTFLRYLKDSRNYYESSLLKDLKRLSPKPLLKPDRQLFETAKCHAIESGISGYVGHIRKKCKYDYYAECCDYGMKDALEIVKHLLIDKGVESLGHRQICMMDLERLGVSIQPHKTFEVNAVLDFDFFEMNK